MVTRSIVGRFLILAILIVAVGVAAQAALILTDGGKKAVKTASAAPAATLKPADPAQSPAGDPVRVVYPGPVGDTTAPTPKLADAAPASPLAGPASQPTAKLALAMSTPTAAAPQPAIPAPASASPPAPAPVSQPAPAPPAEPVAPSPAVASADPDPAAVPLSPPAPAQTASATHAAPTTPAPARVEVASLGGGAPQADSSAAGGVNINTATVESLNRLGGGHIGESIARHRPYRSVEDLVKKRVLRRSVYNHIKNQIAAR